MSGSTDSTEPVRPVVTVSDPGTSAASADVLGDDAPPRRWLPAWVTPLVVGVLAGAVVVPPATAALRDERRADRAARDRAELAAERAALEDTVALRVLDRSLVTDSGARTMTLNLVVATTGLPQSVDGMLLKGGPLDGFRARSVSTLVDPLEAPVELTGDVAVDCDLVRRAFRDGARPAGTAVILTSTPLSGRQQQTEPFPLDDRAVQSALLSACELGDPDVAPTAAVSVVGDRLLVEAGVDEGEDATLTAIRLTGAELEGSTRLPFRLTRFASVISDVRVTTVDCGRVAEGPLVVVFRYDDGRVLEVSATPGDQPGSTSLADFVAALKRTRCA